MGVSGTGATVWPDWIPQEIQHYIAHTCSGQSIRAVARQAGCTPSTVLRRVRRIENRRDDPLMDLALNRLGRAYDMLPSPPHCRDRKGEEMKDTLSEITISEEDIKAEARRVLRRMAEPGACLALAPGMDTAVVVREAGDGPALRTAVVPRAVAEALVLKEWIESYGSGRILRYAITASGRATLKQLVAEDESARAREIRGQGMDGDALDGLPLGTERRKAMRYSLAESPLLVLARRRDKGGGPFLSDTLVAAGERLREGFELSRIGNDTGPALKALISGVSTKTLADLDKTPATRAAAERVKNALDALGPGLSDVALRCCCLLEGMETVERELGWSARSGKIVLRIALQRLLEHYESGGDDWSPLIG